MRKQSPKKKGNHIWKISGAALAVVIVISLAVAGIKVMQGQPEDGDAQIQGQETVGIEEADGEDEVSVPEPGMEGQPEGDGEPEENGPGQPEYLQALVEMGVPIPEKEVDFQDLQENVNEDIYAWIYIPDSKIDYPVLQHPLDNYYYLNYNLDGSYGYPGCIYTERYNKKDFSDRLTVVYGHNMKNGTMFAGLHDYEDSEYFKEHPYVYIYTPDKLLVYKIFVSYESGSEHLLYRHDYMIDSEFKNYLSKVEKARGMNCNRDEDVEVTIDNHVLVLSTCMANKPDNRYLVQGVLLNEE